MGQTGRKKSIRSLIGFELLIKIACLSFCFPAVRFVMKLCMKASGYSYLTKENLFSFLTAPLTLFCIGIAALLLAVFVMYEMNVTIFAVWRNHIGQDVTVPELFFGGIRRTRLLFRKRLSGIAIAFLTLLFVLLVNLPVVFLFLFGVSKTENAALLALRPAGILSVALGAILLWWAAFLGCAMVLLAGMETGDAGSLLKAGIKKVRECYGKLLAGLFRRSILLVLLEGSFYFVGLVAFIAVLVKVTASEISGVLLLRLFERYHMMLCVLFASINAVILEYFCGTLFLKVREKEDLLSPVAASDADSEIREKSKKGIIIFVLFSVGMFFAAATETVSFFKSGNLLFARALDTLCITAHRGASSEAPENTIAAIALAVEEGADYVEIDVRRTADGVPVLLHDEALFRTTRVLGDIGEVTYAEIAEYDAGSSFSEQFSGERLPALQEVLEMFGGKIGFNIELKSIKDRELVRQVVELVEEYHLEKSCVITSASYEQLTWIKEKNPELKTGYVLSLVYGNFYESEAADFFSIRSDFATESLVEKAHSVGKEVHVWTVNKESELRRMKTVGVDNIITDKPAYAREIVFESELAETMEYFLSLLLSKK